MLSSGNMPKPEIDPVECRIDLLTFAETMFRAQRGRALERNWHQDVICTELERVVIGKTKRLIINVPPRSGKTMLAGVNFMAWCMGNFPDSEFIYASYVKSLAETYTSQTRELMQHEAYAKIFGRPSFRPDVNAKDEFRTTQGGVVYAAGAGGPITGFGAGKMREGFGGAIIIDDPHKASETPSNVIRQKVLDWFVNTMESRVNSPDTPIIVIMQRLHVEDLSGFLLDGGNNETWRHIKIPALDEAGKSFWPAQLPVADLDRRKQTSPHVFSGQYQQEPIVAGGNIIKTDNFQFYSKTPILKWRAIYGDTAQKTAERNDYSVLQAWGCATDGRAVLLDQIRGKWEAPELDRMAIAFWQKHLATDRAAYGALRHMKIEDKASGTGLIQNIRRRGGIPVVAVQRDRDKYTRLLDVLGYIESGLVLIPEEAGFLADFMSECQEFSADGTHRHDDQIDPMIDAIGDILGVGNSVKLWKDAT
jgi:predicted phage terminase large subunit-like protein